MKFLGWIAGLSLIVAGSAGSAVADPGKDESGKSRWRGGYERSESRTGSYGVPGLGDDGYERRAYPDDRRQRRTFKEEYDDGRCKYERKLEKSGEYKEEVKCRNGYRSSYRY